MRRKRGKQSRTTKRGPREDAFVKTLNMKDKVDLCEAMTRRDGVERFKLVNCTQEHILTALKAKGIPWIKIHILEHEAENLVKNPTFMKDLKKELHEIGRTSRFMLHISILPLLGHDITSLVKKLNARTVKYSKHLEKWLTHWPDVQRSKVFVLGSSVDVVNGLKRELIQEYDPNRHSSRSTLVNMQWRLAHNAFQDLVNSSCASNEGAVRLYFDIAPTISCKNLQNAVISHLMGLKCVFIFAMAPADVRNIENRETLNQLWRKVRRIKRKRGVEDGSDSILVYTWNQNNEYEEFYKHIPSMRRTDCRFIAHITDLKDNIEEQVRIHYKTEYKLPTIKAKDFILQEGIVQKESREDMFRLQMEVGAITWAPSYCKSSITQDTFTKLVAFLIGDLRAIATRIQNFPDEAINQFQYKNGTIDVSSFDKLLIESNVCNTNDIQDVKDQLIHLGILYQVKISGELMIFSPLTRFVKVQEPVSREKQQSLLQKLTGMLNIAPKPNFDVNMALTSKESAVEIVFRSNFGLIGSLPDSCRILCLLIREMKIKSLQSAPIFDKEKYGFSFTTDDGVMIAFDLNPSKELLRVQVEHPKMCQSVITKIIKAFNDVQRDEHRDPYDCLEAYVKPYDLSNIWVKLELITRELLPQGLETWKLNESLEFSRQPPRYDIHKKVIYLNKCYERISTHAADATISTPPSIIKKDTPIGMILCHEELREEAEHFNVCLVRHIQTKYELISQDTGEMANETDGKCVFVLVSDHLLQTGLIRSRDYINPRFIKWQHVEVSEAMPDLHPCWRLNQTKLNGLVIQRVIEFNPTERKKFHCFLAHSWGPKDENEVYTGHERIINLRNELEERGICCFLDSEEIWPKDQISVAVADGIKQSRFVLLCFTEQYMSDLTNKRNGNARREFDHIKDNCDRRIVVPIDLDPGLIYNVEPVHWCITNDDLRPFLSEENNDGRNEALTRLCDKLSRVHETAD